MVPFEGAIEPLAPHHDRRRFSCGEAALDEYLRRYARQHAESKISRTYVAAEGDRIRGYYSLAMSAISKDQLPVRFQKRLPNFPVPVARLARLAVDSHSQGGGLGKLLLLDALYRGLRMSEAIGMAGMVVDAKHEREQAFCRQFEFESFPDRPLTLWLPTVAIARLFDSRNAVHEAS
ncbi:MAG: GNAT family N-acetyltransferase [Betaproteobacteria bacterium]|nr:GNAT family N-acetyltransferase [Betaproteobacteria bacterium]